LREVVCPVLEFTEEKRTFVKVKGGKVDFSKKKKTALLLLLTALLLVALLCHFTYKFIFNR
jgi:hypothetical protein